MKSIVIALSILGVVAPSSPALAKLGFVPVKVITEGPAGGSPGTGTSTTCQTTTWGDEQAGGSQTVCASSDGSSSWKTAEWADGEYYEDSGGVQMNSAGGFTSTTFSTDSSSSSSGPRKLNPATAAK